MNDRPWYKPYVTTILAVLIVAFALFEANRTVHIGFIAVSIGVTVDGSYGWPVMYYDASYSQTGSEVIKPVHPWFPWGVALDACVAAALLIGTTVVFERWRRSRLRPWQFNLKSILVLTTVVIVVWWLYENQGLFLGWWNILPSDVSLFRQADLDSYSLYVRGPLLLGIGCAVYLSGWAIFRVAWLSLGRPTSRAPL